MKRVQDRVFARLFISLCLLGTLSACDYFRTPEARVDRARKYIEQGEHRRALVELKNALQADSSQMEARLMLAETGFWLGDPASAEFELRKVTSSAFPARLADLQVRIDLAMGRNENALTAVNQEPSALPAAQRALYRGQALNALRKPREAEESFREVLAVDPGNVPARVGIAEGLAARGELARALQMSGETVRDHAQSAAAWYAHGILLARDGKSVPSEEALQRATGLAPRQLEVLRYASALSALIEAQIVNRKLAAARETSQILSRVAPGSTMSTLMAGRVAIAGDDYVAATTELRRVVNAAPKFTQARFMLGVALAAQGNLEQASRELNTVLEQVPENLEARQLLAQVRMRQQDPDGALRVLVPAVQSDTDNSQLSALLDSIRLPAGDSRSIQVLERALKASPETRSLQVQLASAYLQAGKPQQAVDLLRRDAQGADAPREAGLLVQALMQTEGVASASAQMQQALRRNPDDTQMLALAAAFYANNGESGKARELLRAALPDAREKVPLLFSLAQVEWAARQPEAARAALQQLLALEPGNSRAQLALAEVDVARGDITRATQLLETLRSSDSASIEARMALMKLALRRDDAKQARALASEIFEAHPRDVSARRRIGLLYLGFARFDSALEVFRDAEQLDPQDPGLWLAMGRAQAALGQTGPARESFLKSLALRPGWIAPSGALAFLELQSGDRDSALSRIADLKTAQPANAAVLELEGELRSVMRQFAPAASAYEAAFALQPSATLAAKIYSVREVGKLGAPLRSVEQWTRAHPEDVSLAGLLAEGYMKAGNRAAAIAQYERLLKNNSQHVPSLNNVAWLYHEQRDPRAVEFARKASALAPNSAAVSDTLGWILVETGQLAEGLAVLERAVAQPGASPEVHYHHAVALARSGKREDAKRVLAELLRDPAAFPGRPDAEKLNAALQAAERGG